MNYTISDKYTPQNFRTVSRTTLRFVGKVTGQKQQVFFAELEFRGGMTTEWHADQIQEDLKSFSFLKWQLLIKGFLTLNFCIKKHKNVNFNIVQLKTASVYISLRRIDWIISKFTFLWVFITKIWILIYKRNRPSTTELNLCLNHIMYSCFHDYWNVEAHDFSCPDTHCLNSHFRQLL